MHPRFPDVDWRIAEGPRIREIEYSPNVDLSALWESDTPLGAAAPRVSDRRTGPGLTSPIRCLIVRSNSPVLDWGQGVIRTQSSLVQLRGGGLPASGSVVRRVRNAVKPIIQTTLSPCLPYRGVMNTTHRILVGVSTTGSNDSLIERAISQAELEDATLIVANVMPQTLYESRHNAIASVSSLRSDGFSYTVDVARDAARTFAAGVIADAIGDSDVEYVAVGAVGNIGRNLLSIAEEYGCGTIMLGEERSWWRRHTGWDDRELSRTFDGRVILVPRNQPSLVDQDTDPIQA